jgi:hypothetical protein
MAVVTADIEFRLSGGSGNTTPNACLGGIMSSTDINAGVTLNNLFDDISDTEAASGVVDYRCFYILNGNATDTLTTAKVYISTNTPSSDTTIAIGLDPAGVGDGAATGVATTIADEDSAPAGVTFSTPSNSGAALAIGDLANGEAQAVWVRRTVSADAAAAASDPVTLRLIGTP